MLETYSERIGSIEDYYDQKNYKRTVSECGTLVEHVISDTFRRFHTHLETPDERKKFFQFEEKQGDNYANFISRPTMGVSLRFYAPLAKGIFPDHPRMDGTIMSQLQLVNDWRNKVSHASGAEPPGDEDAVEVLEAAETIVEKMGLQEEAHDEIGLPMSVYLIQSSIQYKYTDAEKEGDFRQIVNDSRKLIPTFVNLVIEREYPLLKIEHKKLVVDQYVQSGDLQLSFNDGVALLEKIEFFDRMEGDSAGLARQLDRVLDDSGGTFTRRACRPYISVLSGFYEYLKQPEANVITASRTASV